VTDSIFITVEWTVSNDGDDYFVHESKPNGVGRAVYGPMPYCLVQPFLGERRSVFEQIIKHQLTSRPADHGHQASANEGEVK
jgi:hypothetical protein